MLGLNGIRRRFPHLNDSAFAFAPKEAPSIASSEQPAASIVNAAKDFGQQDDIIVVAVTRISTVAQCRLKGP